MSDPKARLPSDSRKLLEKAADLRDTERQKRNEPISSPSFIALPRTQPAKSHEIFNIAQDDEAVGDETEPGGDTIEDVERNRRHESARVRYALEARRTATPAQSKSRSFAMSRTWDLNSPDLTFAS